MPIAPGTLLGPYEILTSVGAGGMGEVYRARDTRLDRIVAVKVSATEFTERFEREARAVAALNHPRICTLYDVGPNYLVMEYIDGKSLQGPLSMEQVFEYGGQICDALDAAHRKGIVHRDLKPANILVTKAGVKLLDFGLAKWSRGSGVGAATETIALTREHTILGTLQYMSPEQLEAREVDARSDIFAFGTVLYEMVTARRAFAGETQASVTAAIMTGPTPVLSSVRSSVPPALERVVAKCLAKDPDARWQSARDLKDELEWIAGGGSPAAVRVAPAQKAWREFTAWLIAATLLGVAAYAYLRPKHAGEVTRFTVDPPEKTTFAGSLTSTVPAASLAVSPDGRAIVFSASESGARPMLWLRHMDDAASRPLPGTENAQDPFWSPDSRWIAFFSSGRLRKIPVVPGPVQVITENVGDSRGGSWGADDHILFSSGNGPIFRIPSSGGKAVPITKLDPSGDEKSHRWPHLLPDGRHFFFTVRGDPAANGVYVGSLDGKLKKRLLHLDSSALYTSAGYMLFVDDDKLLGQPFDSQRLELTGQPFTIAERVGHSTYGYNSASVSQTGTLVYGSATYHQERPTWFDRQGKMLESIGEANDYVDFRLSPDENRLAFSMVDTRRGYPDIWITDLTRGSTSLFESSALVNAGPTWSPDGSRLAFRSSRNGLIEVFQKTAAGGGKDEVLLDEKTQRALHPGSINAIPTDWSPNSKNIAYTVTSKDSGYDIWMLSIEEKRSTPFLSTPADEMHGNFSPDGRLFAYASNETGKFEVYVQTLPRSDRQWQISNSGGSEPRWRYDGREIYYLSADRKLMAVPVSSGPSFGVPKALFQTRVSMGVMALRTNFVPTRDGKRFLITTQSGDPPHTPLTVILNWSASLKP